MRTIMEGHSPNTRVMRNGESGPGQRRGALAFRSRSCTLDAGGSVGLPASPKHDSAE